MNPTKPTYLLAVSGSRGIEDVAWVERVLQKEVGELSRDHEVILILGDCPRGVDAYAAQWAYTNGWPVLCAKAVWDMYGRSAGPIRNRAMVRACDGLLAIWDGSSKGTKNAIDQAQAVGKLRRVEEV